MKTERERERERERENSEPYWHIMKVAVLLSSLFDWQVLSQEHIAGTPQQYPIITKDVTKIKLTMNLRVITLKKAFTKEVRQTNRRISCDSVTAVSSRKASVVGVASYLRGTNQYFIEKFTCLPASLISFYPLFHSIKFYIECEFSPSVL